MKPIHALLLLSLIFSSCTEETICTRLSGSKLQIEFYRQDSTSGFLLPINLEHEYDSIQTISSLRQMVIYNYISVELGEEKNRTFLFYRDGSFSQIVFRYSFEKAQDESPDECGTFNIYKNLTIIKSDFQNSQVRNFNSYNNTFIAVIILS